MGYKKTPVSSYPLIIWYKDTQARLRTLMLYGIPKLLCNCEVAEAYIIKKQHTHFEICVSMNEKLHGTHV